MTEAARREEAGKSALVSKNQRVSNLLTGIGSREIWTKKGRSAQLDKGRDREKDETRLTDSHTSSSRREKVHEQVRVGSVESIHILLPLSLSSVSIESDVGEVL